MKAQEISEAAIDDFAGAVCFVRIEDNEHPALDAVVKMATKEYAICPDGRVCVGFGSGDHCELYSQDELKKILTKRQA